MQDLVNVGICESPESALATALRVGRHLTGADAMLGAVTNDEGSYTMRAADNVVGDGLIGIMISGGIGLGGRVLGEGRPVGVDDYTTETTISGHYKQLVSEAGLHGIACVAAGVAGGPGVLLYGAMNDAAAPGGRATETLERVAEVAALSLHRLAERRRNIDLEVLRERQRIAFALHDSVAQMLFAIGVSAQQSQRERDPDVLARALSEIEATAAGARAELRDVFARLSEPLPGLALDAVLEAEARLFRRQSGCHVVVTGDGEPRVLTDLAQALIVDVAREGLRNACKHADARIAVVHVGYEDRGVTLTVQAEGMRAGPGLARSQSGFVAGSGLDILVRRAEQLGGGLSLTVGEQGAAVLRLELA